MAFVNSPVNLGPDTVLHGKTDSMAAVTSARKPELMDGMSDNEACTDADGTADERRGGGPRLRGDATKIKMTSASSKNKVANQKSRNLSPSQGTMPCRK